MPESTIIRRAGWLLAAACVLLLEAPVCADDPAAPLPPPQVGPPSSSRAQPKAAPARPLPAPNTPRPQPPARAASPSRVASAPQATHVAPSAVGAAVPAGALALPDDPAPSEAGADAGASEDPPETRRALTFYPENGYIERDNKDIVYFYRTNFATPVSLIAALTSVGFANLPGIKSLKEYAAQNQLVIEGDPDVVRLLVEALQFFDVSEPQVFIEAKVIEITHEGNFEFGLGYWMDRNEQGPDTLVRGFSGVLNPSSALRSAYPPEVPFQGASLLLGLVGSNADKYGLSDMTLQALQVSGKAEVLSRPSLIATQGKPASVVTEEQTPILTLQQAVGTVVRTAGTGQETVGDQVTVRSAPVKTGVSLTVTPEHIGNRYVRLTINPQVDGVAGLASIRAGGAFAPITTMRKVSTTVTLGDGETLVIGGLYTNQRTTEKARTPLISDLPLLGHLFTRTKETKQKTELIFILTPHIVDKTSDLKIVVPPKELERLESHGDKEIQPCKPPFAPSWGAQFEE